MTMSMKRQAIARLAGATVIVAAMVPVKSRAQEPAGGPVSINTTSAGYLGITSLRCDCTLRADPEPRNRFFVFRSDPVVRSIEPRSPAAARLRTGDVITHIDGVALATTPGARRFATIQPGQTVELTVRRGRTVSKPRLTAVPLDWNDNRLLGNTAPEVAGGYSVTWDYEDAEPSVPAVPAAPAAPVTPAAPVAGSWSLLTPRPPGVPSGVWAVEVPPSSASPRGWFGFSVRCNQCGWASGARGESPVWESREAPELSMISAGSPASRAGLLPGDVLTHIDGVSILTPAGARKFGGVMPGQTVRVTVKRDGRSITRELTLTGRPEARAARAVIAARPPRAPGAAVAPTPPAARRELRYTGRLEDVTVEVWSAGGPSVERVGDTMVITVGGTVVRLRVDPKRN